MIYESKIKEEDLEMDEPQRSKGLIDIVSDYKLDPVIDNLNRYGSEMASLSEHNYLKGPDDEDKHKDDEDKHKDDCDGNCDQDKDDCDGNCGNCGK